MKKTIKILGAGPAGLTAAINLAARGYKVNLYERYSEIGRQRGQNAQLLPNWFSKDDIIIELEKYNIEVNPVAAVSKIEVYFDDQNIFTIYGRKTPIGYTVLRCGKNSLEEYLAQQAEKLGVNIKTNWKEKIEADIIATGTKRADALIYGGMFKGKFDQNKPKVYFDFKHTPGSYFYLFPHADELATFVIGTIARLGGNPRKSFEELITKKQSFLGIKNSNLIYTFGGRANFEIPKTAKEGKSLLVGEAAGFIDPLFGFGMYYAIKSGYLAAKSIWKGVNYDTLWKKAFLFDLIRLGLYRRFLLEKLKEEGVKHLGQGRKVEVEMETVKKFYLSWTNKIFPFLCPLLPKRFLLRTIFLLLKRPK